MSDLKASNCDIKTFCAKSGKHFSRGRLPSAGSRDSSFLFISLSPLTRHFFFSFSSFFWATFFSFHAPPEEEINLARRGQLCSRKLFRRAVCLPLWGRFIKEAVGRLRISLGMMTALRRGSEGGGGVKPLFPALWPSAQGRISVGLVQRWKASLSVLLVTFSHP